MEALCDTGAQVSIFPEQVLSDNFSDLKIRDISELLGANSDLNLTAANGTMQEAYTLASKSAEKAASKGRKQSDKRIRSTVLLPGDQVLVRNLSSRGGPGKIRAFWEEEIHVVVSRNNPETTPETKRVVNVKEQTPILHTPEDSESDSEGLSLPPNAVDELVQLSLRPDSVNDATVDPSTNGDINQSREVHGNENEENRLIIQVEERWKRRVMSKKHRRNQLVHKGKDSHRYVLDTTHLAVLGMNFLSFGKTLTWD
ncbi:Hypothetical predicted protein [Paramuricea clavata]|uniref:Uncharacterized protein n=1 Tax=Paramuricea clavata TaxID=317549 RepID=A0A7D9LYZ1_PARCT|nr:Hypothetical predicted protein [Paramuricea clavata]